MSKVDLVASKPLRYGGRSLEAGDPFDASPRDARILKAIRKAADAPVEDVEAKQAAEELETLRASYTDATGDEPDGRWGAARLSEEIAKAKKPKGYQRRDLRAED